MANYHLLNLLNPFTKNQSSWFNQFTSIKKFMKDTDKPLFSIILPTYNERDNIKFLIPAIINSVSKLNLKYEIIVVDDNSPDNTKEVVENLAGDFSGITDIRLILRKSERGLVSAIMSGIYDSNADVLCVLDADGSHPVNKIKSLILPVLNKDVDFTIGSRYICGGRIDGWKLTRKILSRLGSISTIGLTPVRDSMSGFFCFRKPSNFPLISNKNGGFKIALELLCKIKPKSVTEIPITFEDRKIGKSKLSFKVIYSFFLQLITLYFKKFF